MNWITAGGTSPIPTVPTPLAVVANKSVPLLYTESDKIFATLCRASTIIATCSYNVRFQRGQTKKKINGMQNKNGITTTEKERAILLLTFATGHDEWTGNESIEGGIRRLSVEVETSETPFESVPRLDLTR